MDKEQNHADLTTKKVKESRPKRSERALGAVRQKKRAAPSKIVGTNPKSSKPVSPAPGVEELIQNWRPYLRSDRLIWPEIAQVVRSHVLAAKPRDLVVAHKYIRTLSKHAILQNKAGHLITDAAELFSDRALVATFGQSNPFGLAVSSLATELSFMRRMREEILPDIFAIPTPLVKGTSHIALPYTDDELKILLPWARQRSKPRNIRIHGGLIFGLGAGIDGFEMSKITGHDVICTPWGLVVRAPGMRPPQSRPARLVPVLAKYERELANLAQRAGNAPILGATTTATKPRAASRVRVKTPNIPEYNSRKPRSNWTRDLLKNGASYVAMRQAGISVAGDKTLAQLSSDLSIPFQELVTQLRFGTAPFDPTLYSFLTQYESSQR